jgi:hypothetical protein
MIERSAILARIEAGLRRSRVRDLEPTKVKTLPLVPDREGEVALLRVPGPLAFEGPQPDVVHPLLVYLDLLTEDHDRARDAAAEIYRRYLEEARA